MEKAIQKVINNNILLLVDFILEKYPIVNKEDLIKKLNTLIKIPLNACETPLNVIEKIKSENLVIQAKKSEFSNYVLSMNTNNLKFQDLLHSKFVIDLHTKKIIGTEKSNGEIEPLNKDLILIANKYKLKYDLPLILNLDDEDILIIDEMNKLGLNHVDSDDDENDD